MHFLPPLLSPTLVASPGGTSSKSTAMLPEIRHLDIPWNEFYCRTITSSCATSIGYETQNTLSERDTYILRLHARARNTISPTKKHRSSFSTPLPPSSSFGGITKNTTSTSISRPSRYGVSRLTKRFRRETTSHRLSKAVLLKNSFEAAARDFDAMGNGFAAEKQRKRARLPQGFINRISEQDDPRSWTFPPSRLNGMRRNSVPTRKSTLVDVVFSSGGMTRLR